MQQQQQTIFIDDDTAPDDIDRLFSHLQQIEPPPSFISRLLSQIQSQTAAVSLFPQPLILNKLDTWVAQNEQSKLC